MVVCEDSRCKLGEVCAVVKGMRWCVANRCSICVATGDHSCEKWLPSAVWGDLGGLGEYRVGLEGREGHRG